MSNKKFSPVRVTNPTSKSHLVKVHQGQSIIVRLDSKQFPEPDPILTTDYLILKSKSYDGKSLILNIDQSDLVLGWDKYSSVALGEIKIRSVTNQKTELNIVLASSEPEKEAFITVCNPQNRNVRLQAGDIFEVILFDNESIENDIFWDWEWYSSIGIDVDLIGEDILFPGFWTQKHHIKDTDKQDQPYARFPRCGILNKYWGEQKHYWFRFTDSLYKLVSDQSIVDSANIIRLGTFVFQKFANDEFIESYDCDILVDARRSNAMRIVRSRLLKKKDELSSPLQIYKPSVSSIASSFSLKPKFNIIKDVQIELIQSEEIDTGCNTISAIRQNNVKNTSQFYSSGYDYDDDDNIVVYPTYYSPRNLWNRRPY